MPDAAFAAFRTFPGDQLTIIQRSQFRDFNDRVIDRIEELPANYAGLSGQVLVVNNSATGPKNAAASGITMVDFAGLEVGNFKQRRVSLAGPASLTTNGHLGANVLMINGSAATITVAINANPAVGIADGFICEIRRAVGSGAVQIVAGSGLSLFNADGHTRIKDGCVARLTAESGTLYFEGRTET